MLALPQTLTMGGAPDTLRMLSQALRDSAAIAVLLECRRLAQAWGKNFEVHAAPQKLRDLAHMYGVQDLVKIA